MGRTILPGARIRIAAAPHPRAGAVWAFCDPQGRVVVHRYLGRRSAGLVFQGDGRSQPDPLVAPDTLIGRVVEVEGPGGAARSLGWRDRIWRGLPAVARCWARAARRRILR